MSKHRTTHLRSAGTSGILALLLLFALQACTEPMGPGDVPREEAAGLGVGQNGHSANQQIGAQEENGGDEGGEEEAEKVEVCHVPPGNPEAARTLEVDEDDVQDHLDHGDTLGECGERGGDDEGESEKVAVCHVPPGNPENARTLEVDEDDVQDHLDHGDTLGECGEGGGDDDQGAQDDEEESEKVMVCHVPPGNPDNARTLEVDEDDVQDHLDHGDTLGECGEGGEDDGEGGQDDEEEGHKVLVCHTPPGNPDKARTLEVDRSALDAHLAHGDTEGACEDQQDGRGGGG